MLETLVNWLVGCWNCDGCSWFSLFVSVVSCILRAAIIAGFLYLVSVIGKDALSAL